MTPEQHRELGEALRAHRRSLLLADYNASRLGGGPSDPSLTERLERTEELISLWKANPPS